MSSEELSPHDHRRIGRELGLFHLQEEAAGSVFWHARGYTLFRTIESYIRNKLHKAGYQEVKTPQLFARGLWEHSGHWDKFRENMFCTGDLTETACYSDLTNFTEAVIDPISTKPDGYAYSTDAGKVLKPMNCPAHVQIFNASEVTYKHLPLRMAEFGCCHRNEPSGSLHGIMRVRQFTQDDAHIFCTEDQVQAETEAFCKLLLGVYRDFGFEDVIIGFSTRPDKRGGTDEMWDRAEASLMGAVQAAGLEFVIQPGEGAFYGPKLEFALVDARGQQWQCGTLQLDFLLPERLGAHYMAEDGSRRRPVMLHRAILGSLERFIGILLDHYEGNLPPWLAPEQAVVVTVKSKHADEVALADWASNLVEQMEREGLRAKTDTRDLDIRSKVKEHSEMKIPFIIAIGQRDLEQEYPPAALRTLGKQGQETMAPDAAIDVVERHCKIGGQPLWSEEERERRHIKPTEVPINDAAVTLDRLRSLQKSRK